MSTGCDAFRSALHDAAGGSRGALARLVPEGHGAHGAACAACRAALARETALERVLARVPRPVEPPELAARVLTRLAPERARRHAGGAEEDELEALLERLPAPAVPVGLSSRVLAGLAVERAPRIQADPRRRLRLLGVAAALALALGAWAWSVRARPDDVGLPLAPEAELAALEADAELLAYAAERWELLNDADLDVWLASLDPLDELLVEYADAGVWPDEGAPGEAR
jgi:hypothetical protein